MITSHRHQYSFKYQHILLLYPTLIPPNQSWQLSHISHSLPFHYSTSLWTNQHISRMKCKMSHHSIFFPTNLCSHNQTTLPLGTSPTWNQKQKIEKPDQDHDSRFRINGVYLNHFLDFYTNFCAPCLRYCPGVRLWFSLLTPTNQKPYPDNQSTHRTLLDTRMPLHNLYRNILAGPHKPYPMAPPISFNNWNLEHALDCALIFSKLHRSCIHLCP